MILASEGSQEENIQTHYIVV